MLSLVEQQSKVHWGLPASLWQGLIVIIVIDLRIEKSSDDIQMIDGPAMFSDHGDEISKSSELSIRGINFSEMRFFVVLNQEPSFVPNGAVRIVFRLVAPISANWLD